MMYAGPAGRTARCALRDSLALGRTLRGTVTGPLIASSFVMSRPHNDTMHERIPRRPTFGPWLPYVSARTSAVTRSRSAHLRWPAVPGSRCTPADASQFQYPNVASIAVLDDGLVARGKNQTLGASGGNQEAVSRISMRVAWQESTFGS